MKQSCRTVFRHYLATWPVGLPLTRGQGKQKNTAAKTPGAAVALILGLALAPSARAQSVVVDGTNVGTTWTTATSLGWPGSPVTVTVNGAGASWAVSNASIGIGNAGTGRLNVLNGGVVTSVGGTVGDNGGNGYVSIDGAGSSWTTSVLMFVGATGTGTLSITHGASLSTSIFLLGVQGGNGTVTVDGAGSSLTVSGNSNAVGNGNGLAVGSDLVGAGTGVLTVQNSGSVSANAVYLGYNGSGNGTVNVNSSGVLQAGYIQKASPQGVLTFDGGVLRASGNQPQFLQGFSARDVSVGNGGAFIDTQGYSVGITTAGVFAGSGGITKQGSGTLSIAGSNTWGGNTTVSAGTLVLDNYTQSRNQTLTVGAASTSNYGKLSVANTATFNAGANLAVNVAGVNSLANGQTLTGVVSAGTLNASTFNVTGNSALFNFSAVLNGNSVDLKISSINSGNSSGSSGSSGDVTSTGVFDAVNAFSRNAAFGAARVLDIWVGGAPTGDMANVVTALGKLPDQRSVANAVEQTLPQNFGAQATMSTLSSINHVLAGRLASGSSGVSSGDGAMTGQAWVKPFGSHASQSDQDGASGFSANTWGVAAGVERDWDDLRLGVGYAYANTRVSGNTALSGADNTASIDTNLLALYGSRTIGGITLGFQVDGGWNNNRSNRTISFGNLNRSASGSYDAWSAHAGSSLSKAITLSAANTWIPALRIDYTHMRSQAYTETGADSLNLNVDAKKTEALVLGVDNRFIHAFSEKSLIEASVGVGYDLINDKGNLVASYAGEPGQSFVASGIDHGAWIAKAGVGYTYRPSQSVKVSIRYDAEGRRGYLNQSGSVRLNWIF
ncbi:MAG: autotransporter domain-containing protein [Pandoraea sp.]|nr:autotransporter domain-containing protein [Pandoraea sp.]MDR3397435.1 autotransporter domain-containing protein [Pandoraea sp.]